ncbi:hypothetical protein [Kordia sp.]|uniref:hypothetical protein n=1 Tax=Kordia sp. TaxID=1965332 RepID=UPI003D6AD9AC
MKNKIYVFLMVLMEISIVNASEPVDVANLSVKLSFQKTIDHYYSFDEGDEIVFNMEMIKGRHIKSIEITALPSNILLSEFKAKKLVNQRIKIKKKGVVRFRFYSSSLTNRVCRARIQRIPSDASKIDFNTDWKWKVLKDTTYVKYTQDSLTGYRTVKYQEKVKKLKEERTEEILIFDKSQRVHSRTNLNNNKSYLRVSLPNLINTNYWQEKLLSWAYWIGVGEASQEAYQKNLESVKELAKGVATRYMTPLGALAVGKITNMILPNIGDDVQYYFILDYENAQKFYNDHEFYQFDMGKGRAAFGRHDQFPKGSFYIGLSNDNLTRGINVNVKVIAVKQVKIFEDVIYNREREEPQYITLHKTRMKINETSIRIPVE